MTVRKARWRILAALILGVTTACGGGAAVSDIPSDDPSFTMGTSPPLPTAAVVVSSPPSASATPAISATASPAPTNDAVAPITWSMAVSESTSARVEAMAHGAAGFVAVGFELPEIDPGPTFFGRTWISRHGTQWELLPPDTTFEGAYLSDVVATPEGGYLALGFIRDHTRDLELPLAMWESPDGRAWQRLDLGALSDVRTPPRVVEGPKGYLLNAADQLWYATDARNWEPVRADGDADREQTYRVAAGADGFVAVGMRRPTAGAAMYVIASADGRQWFEGPPNPDLTLYLGAVGGDWVMASQSTEAGRVPILFSTNGLDWERGPQIETQADVRHDVFKVTSAGATVFVGLSALGAHPAIMPAGIWSSTDGMAWTQVPVGDVYLAAAAASGQTLSLAVNSGDLNVGTTFLVRSGGE